MRAMRGGAASSVQRWWRRRAIPSPLCGAISPCRGGMPRAGITKASPAAWRHGSAEEWGAPWEDMTRCISETSSRSGAASLPSSVWNRKARRKTSSSAPTPISMAHASSTISRCATATSASYASITARPGARRSSPHSSARCSANASPMSGTNGRRMNTNTRGRTSMPSMPFPSHRCAA